MELAAIPKTAIVITPTWACCSHSEFEQHAVARRIGEDDREVVLAWRVDDCRARRTGNAGGHSCAARLRTKMYSSPGLGPAGFDPALAAANVTRVASVKVGDNPVYALN